jgi:hypothetical protein
METDSLHFKKLPEFAIDTEALLVKPGSAGELALVVSLNPAEQRGRKDSERAHDSRDNNGGLSGIHIAGGHLRSPLRRRFGEGVERQRPRLPCRRVPPLAALLPPSSSGSASGSSSPTGWRGYAVQLVPGFAAALGAFVIALAWEREREAKQVVAATEQLVQQRETEARRRLATVRERAPRE